MKTKTTVYFSKYKPDGLKETIGKILKDENGTYAVAIKNLKTNQTYYLNENMIFESGSLYKLWVLITVFDKIEKGDLQKDKVLSQDIEVLNNKFEIAKEDAEIKTGSITLSVMDALNQMIIISHNYAAMLLLEEVKISVVSKFLEDNGFIDSKTGQPPKTTAKETARFLEKIYKKEFLQSEENSLEVIELLKKQQLNDGLPKYLPKDTSVAHKTGEIGWFKHDAGIIFSPGADYIIVVMSDTNSPLSAQEKIAEISKAVYDFFK